MAADLRLSKGAINAMLEGRVRSADASKPAFKPPLMQLLGAKPMQPSCLRAVLFDGLTINQHCILTHHDAERLFAEGNFGKFTVIRVRSFAVNTIPEKNVTVLMVNQMDLVRDGKEINDKLEGTDWAYLSQRSGGDDEVVATTSAVVATAAEEAVAAPTLAPREATTTAAAAATQTSTRPSPCATPSSPMKKEEPADSAYGGSSALVSRPPLIMTKSATSTTASSSPSTSKAGGGGAAAPGVFPTTSTLQGGQVTPINVISPFYTSWVIRVRVTSKTPLKTYNTARGAGHVFSFDTVDKSGGELRITAFNAEADKWYGLIERGRVYLISKGAVKVANKRFNTLNSKYEVTLTGHSVIEPVDDQAVGGIPFMRYNFKPLSDVERMAVGTTIDVIGVVRAVGELESFVARKTGREVTKREVTIVDRSLYEARVTFWGGLAEGFTANVGEVVALKSVLVGEFKGKTLGTIGSTVVDVEPAELAEVGVLRHWYHGPAPGSAETFKSLSGVGGTRKLDNSHRFVGQLTEKLVQKNAANVANKPATSAAIHSNPYANPSTYSSVYGTISAISKRKEGTSHLYKSCANEAVPGGCMKKVTDEAGDGTYYCPKCDRTMTTFKWRFMLSVEVADATGSTWITIFQENAEKLLGVTAQELADLLENSPKEYAAKINQLRFTALQLRLGSRMEEYNGEKRVRSSLYGVVPAGDPVERSRRLLAMIPKMQQQLEKN
ncbi:60S acidic ribosomal protein P1 [Tyrophagus putrescentiae]|nr:60S acidic ribosomal protein P1 [Tyrophagus putrescentiae]